MLISRLARNYFCDKKMNLYFKLHYTATILEERYFKKMNSYYVEILVNLFALLVKADMKEKQRKSDKMKKVKDRQPTKQKSRKPDTMNFKFQKNKKKQTDTQTVR